VAIDSGRGKGFISISVGEPILGAGPPVSRTLRRVSSMVETGDLLIADIIAFTCRLTLCRSPVAAKRGGAPTALLHRRRRVERCG